LNRRLMKHIDLLITKAHYDYTLFIYTQLIRVRYAVSTPTVYKGG